MGYAPFAPATFGSALGAAIYWFFIPQNPLILLPLTCGLFFLGVWISGNLVEIWGEDARRIVIDEICGMMVTMILFPKSIKLLILGFALFRIFDIWKPFPLNKSERLRGGFGIMADDLLAGIYANLTLRLMFFLLRNLIVP